MAPDDNRTPNHKETHKPADSNPLFDPQRYGSTFAFAVAEIKWTMHEPDAREVAMSKIEVAMTEVKLRRDPPQWARDLVSRVCRAVVDGEPALPAQKRGPKSRPHPRAVSELKRVLQPHYASAEDAEREAIRRLERPLRGRSVAELVSLVRPLARSNEEARAWVAEFVGLSEDRIKQLSR